MVGELMFRNLSISTKMFGKNSMNFMIPTLYWGILKVVYFFSLFGILYLLFVGLTVGGINFTKSIWLALLGITFFVFVFWDSSLKGSLINAYKNGMHRKKTIFMEFFTSGKKYRGRIFTIQVIRLVLIGILMLPWVLIYEYVPTVSGIPYIAVILALIFIFIWTVVSYFTFPGIILISIKDLSVGRALKRGLRYLKRNPIESLILYILYGITSIVNIIPMIDFISLFLVLPVIYSGLVNSLDRY